MAAIAGLLNDNGGRPVDRNTVEGMLQRLVVYPADRIDTWTAGAVHLSCANIAGAKVGEAEALKIVADARLDDRPALAASLGLDARQFSDVELIGRAFEKWGRDCPRHLTGDFAFAIWDGAQRRLFCARDQFGVKPFHYRCDRGGLAFATRLNAIALPSDGFSRSRVAGFLAGIDDSHEETVFSNIRRLPMGHWLAWSPGRLRIERYYTPTADAVAPNENFVEGFRERFFSAVDDRSMGATDLGAFLSGGLDSSSIVSAVARRDDAPPLRTFSFSYPLSSRYDETEYGTAVLQKYRLAPEFIDMDDIAPLDGLADLADGMDDLFFAPGLPKIARLLAQARRSGVRLMLDGHGGDEVVSQGFGRLGQLARERRWASLYRELRGVSAVSGQSTTGLLAQFYMGQGLMAKARKWVGRRGVSAMRPSHAEQAASLLAPGFVRDSGLNERIQQATLDGRRARSSEASLHLWNVSSPPVARAFETLRRAGDQVGIELRFPFYDRRLLTYALAVPDSEKLKDGWPRSVLRRAMEGILPAKVQWRRDKIDFGPELAAGLVYHHSDLLHEVLRDDAAVAEYVDLDLARSRVRALLAAPEAADTLELLALWRVVLLALWLNNRGAVRQPEKVQS